MILRNFVNGEYVDAKDGRASEVVDPSAGTACDRVPRSGQVDVDAALNAAATAFQGWRDSTPQDRSLALRRIADAVESRATRDGPPEDESAFYGPLNNAAQLERVGGFLERAPDHAEVVAGGARLGDTGYFYASTVVTGLNQDDEMVQDEIFGPVITVQRFTTDGFEDDTRIKHVTSHIGGNAAP